MRETQATPAIAKPPRRAQRGQDIIQYPDSDDKPIADTDPQYRCITDTRFALEQYYADNPQVYVGADLLMYYEEGDPTKSVAPDVLVSLGAPKGNRRTYLIWEEGKPPEVVFEFASEHSWRADLGWKFGLYQGLGIQEYFVFDPHGEYVEPALQGYRLGERTYEVIDPLTSDRGMMGVSSEVLELELWMQSNGGEDMPYVLRLCDPAAGTWLRTPAEEAQARRQAEAHVAELEMELKRLRTQPSQDES